VRIAIVEDNVPLADGMAHAFRAEGHGVDLLHDGDAASMFLATEEVDLIILDINLAGQSGFEVLKTLRAANTDTPVLMVTARDGIDDKVSGLDLGADDYLTKPFELAELLARTRALLRRGNKTLSAVITIGKLVFDPNARTLATRGKVLDLPRREFALAELLINRKGHVISKNQILEHLYGAGTETEEGAVELYVHRLRKKLVGSGIEIKTMRGLGYCLREKA